MVLSAGQRIGHYEIVSALRADGMGEVYRAHDATLKRDVALKILPRSVSNDVEPLERFEREARVLASLTVRGAQTTRTARNLPRARPPARDCGGPSSFCVRPSYLATVEVL